MGEVLVFGEDVAHEIVLVGLLKRLAEDLKMELRIMVRSSTGGHGLMIKELKTLLRELEVGQTRSPDLVVVGRDANCKGYQDCKRSLEVEMKGFMQLPMVFALPDPHIERWLLDDSAAFKKVLGQGCALAKEKCDRDRYKKLLDQAVRDAGLRPLQGGLEHAEDIIKELDLARAEKVDKSLSHFLGDARRALRQWHEG